MGHTRQQQEHDRAASEHRSLSAISLDKSKEGRDHATGGFDVRSFEIMEESMVSVPANPDCEQGSRPSGPLRRKWATNPSPPRACEARGSADWGTLSCDNREPPLRSPEPWVLRLPVWISEDIESV